MLTDNIMFLKQSYPTLLENIRNKGKENIIEIETTKNSEKTLKLKKDDTRLYLHSKYNPTREAEAIIDKLEEREDINENSHIIFYGLGLGYHIEIFVKKYTNTKFSLYEPSVEVFNAFLDHVNLKDLGTKNIETIACEYDLEARQEFLSHIMKNKEGKIIILKLPIYEKTFDEKRKDFFESFKNTVKNERSSLHTNLAFQKRWIINSMKNFKEVLNTPNILLEKKSAFKDKPAILVAAGPSLNEEIENIRYIKENGLAYIFSVGSAINTLIHHGIYPDAATTYDPGEFNQNVFKTIKEKEIKEVPMIFGSSVGYETLENYPGEKYHMITSQDTVSNYYLKSKRDESINIVQDAPTIAVVTLQLLSQLGFNIIVLVGQNLAYKGKKKHSEGISYSDDLTKEQLNNSISVKNVHGEDILTNRGFNSMREQMENYIKLLSHIRVVNTTKDGANIEGADFIELDEIIKKYLNKNIVEEDFLKDNKTKYDVENLQTKLTSMDIKYKNALKINKDYKNIIKRIEKSIKNRKISDVEELYVKLDKQLKRIESNDFYKMFILPMNRIQYKILVDSIDSLNSINNPYDKGKRIIESFTNFIDICEKDINDIEDIYIDMKQDIETYINIDGRNEV